VAGAAGAAVCLRASANPGLRAAAATPAKQAAAGFTCRFGAALTVGIALITQMGEQVDYLRFMPERTPANRGAGGAAVLVGGPGLGAAGRAEDARRALLAYLR
jgi:hypothetical protein